MRILLIEDDARLAARTAEYLQGHGATVEIVPDGAQGLDHARSGTHDIVLLDLMLPGLSGLELCKELRNVSSIPVIMLTARGDEIDRVVGLELGADDYVSKPFSPRELLARIRAVLRRHCHPAAGDDSPRRLGGLRIDKDRRIAELHDQRIELTAYQFDLLWVLTGAPDHVMSRGDLHDAVRKLRRESPTEFEPSVDRSIDMHFSKIRAALGAAHSDGVGLIQTVRGVGYVWKPVP